MSFWTIMNWAAWALSAALAGHMAWDFIKVEKQRRESERKADREQANPP